jgi:hypothetical protein
MALKCIKKIIIITKSGLYKWQFGLKMPQVFSSRHGNESYQGKWKNDSREMLVVNL